MNPQEFYEKQYKHYSHKNQRSAVLKGLLLKWHPLGADVVLKMMRNERDKRILDIGCGDGDLLFKLKDNFDELYGVDIAKNRILRANKRAKKRKEKYIFKQVDVDKLGLPFKNNYFDAITCVALLEHVFDPYFVVAEIARTLRPKGMLILLVPNIAYLKHRLRLLSGKLPKTSGMETGWDGGHLHYFTKKALIKLLKQNHLKILKVSGSGLLAPLRNWWPSLLTGDLIVKARNEKK